MSKSVFPKYDRYKDSGVEWLGEIPEHWEAVPNRALLTEQREKVGKNAADYTLLSLTLNGVIPRDMENPPGKFPAEFNTYTIVDPDDLVFCLFDIDETPRAIGHSVHHGMITGAYNVYELTRLINPRYIYYYYLFLDAGKRLKPLYSGLRKTIQRGVFASVKSPLPPKSEQDCIVRFLDRKTTEIDALIAKNQRQIELLDEQKAIRINLAVMRGIVNSEFGMKNEFLEGMENSECGIENSKNRSGNSTFCTHNSKFKPSGIEWIGDIPEHWKMTKLRRILAVSPKNGISPPVSPSAGTPTLFIAAGKNGTVTFGDNVKYAEISRRDARLYRIRKGDILALRGNGSRHLVATCGIVGDDAPSGCIYPDLLIKFVPDEKANSGYFVSLMNGPLRGGIELVAKTSAGIWKISGENLSSLSVPQPPRKEQESIIEYVRSVAAAKRTIEVSLITEIKSLKNLRSTLIAHAVTGRIKCSKN